MIQLASETQELIARRARQEGTSPDALVRKAIDALPLPEDQSRTERAKLDEALARLDGLTRSPDVRPTKEILDQAWAS